jgi:uncharacterized membrane protein YidH (DUF202 family)
MSDRTPPTGPLLDAGLQPERTALAWRRTVLALTLGGVVALRVLPPALGGWGVVAGLCGVAGGLLMALFARRRHATVSFALRDNRALPGGLMLAAVTCVVAVGAAVSIAAVLSIVALRAP